MIYLKRKPDQLLQITDTHNETFILQLEFQLIDESEMIYRMLEYRALLTRKYRLPIRQYVLFLSDLPPQMTTRLEERHLSFAFELVWMAQIDYNLFLSSSKPDEVVLAVLGNFGIEDPETVATKLIGRLTETASGKLELEKYLEQLRILANLRKLKPFIEQIMDSITKYIKPEDDFLYQKGEEKGIEKGKLEGKIEGKLEGKVEVILKFLKDGILNTKQIASYFDVTEEFIENLRQ